MSFTASHDPTAFSSLRDMQPCMRIAALLCGVALLLLATSCTQLPSTGVTTIQFVDDKRPDRKELRSESVQAQVVERGISVDQFRLRGPFEARIREGGTIQLSAKERIPADFYISAEGTRAPLVILLHGYNNGKADHAYQGLHLATWGINCIVVQVASRGSWITHGRTLARIVDHIRKRPKEFYDIDTSRIVLVGHSFGGSSVVYALGQGAAASGAVLLDPASYGRNLITSLERVKTPVMVLSADDEVFPARGRDLFYAHLRGNTGEVSIRNAGHEDAQFKLSDDGSHEEQLAFISALTAAVISITSTGSFDYAWQSYGPAIDSGRFFAARKK